MDLVISRSPSDVIDSNGFKAGYEDTNGDPSVSEGEEEVDEEMEKQRFNGFVMHLDDLIDVHHDGIDELCRFRVLAVRTISTSSSSYRSDSDETQPHTQTHHNSHVPVTGEASSGSAHRSVYHDCGIQLRWVTV